MKLLGELRIQHIKRLGTLAIRGFVLGRLKLTESKISKVLIDIIFLWNNERKLVLIKTPYVGRACEPDLLSKAINKPASDHGFNVGPLRGEVLSRMTPALL